MSGRPPDHASELLAAALRAYTAEPLAFTFRQLRRVVERLVSLGEAEDGLDGLTLGDLEAALEPEGMGHLPLRTIVAIVDAVAEASRLSAPEDVFDNLDLGRLAAVADRAVPRLTVDDVVALAGLARGVNGANDVLAELRLATVRQRLSAGALSALPASDMREAVERLARA